MYFTGLYTHGGLHQTDFRHFVLYKFCKILDHEVRVTKVQINYFVAPLVVLVSVVMSSDSDDSVSLSGSESELHLDDIVATAKTKTTISKASQMPIFQLKFSVSGRKQPTTTAIILRYLTLQMLALRETTKESIRLRYSVCLLMKKFFKTSRRGRTEMPRRSEPKIQGNTRLNESS